MLLLVGMGIQPIVVRINHLPRQEGMNEGETERRRMKEGRKEGYGLPLRFHSQNILEYSEG